MAFIGTWTFGNNPATSPRDWVRMQIGDTDPTDPLLSDEMIASFLAAKAPYWAAAAACEAIAAQFSRLATKHLGTMTIAQATMGAQYLKMAQALRVQGIVGIVPFAGGQSVAGKIAQEEQPDRVAPGFTRNLMDWPGTGPEYPSEPGVDPDQGV